jgi:hypothetical protein
MPGTVVSDGANVYWVNTGNSTLMKCGAAGCGRNPNLLVNPGTLSGVLGPLVVDDTYAYFAALTGSTSTIYRIAK